ncbi:MAG: helix-turn-helix domain-containing protein [Bacteroidota bacterium]|nr:helix-turn-helix domain-containing protein [Bacteroidota bacterium]
MSQKNIPVYSIDTFKDTSSKSSFQVEKFDHKRHYNVEYPHRHDFFYEVLYIKEGSGKYVIDFEEYEIKPETIFFVVPGQVHEISFSEDIMGYIFLFTEEFLSISNDEKFYWLFDQFSFRKDPTKITNDGINQKLNWLFINSIENYEKGDKYSDTICQNNLRNILLYCSRLYEDLNYINHKKGKGFSLIRQFKSLIDQHYMDNWSVKDYANKLSVTPSHLNETIKTLSGVTATSMLDNKLLVEIKRYLAYTEYDITEIAYKFNFKDQSYFSRFFRNKSNLTPSEFRTKTIKST